MCRLQLDDLTSQHEGYARQLRDRLLREQDLAVEKERAAAQDRLREAAERCYLTQPTCSELSDNRTFLPDFTVPASLAQRVDTCIASLMLFLWCSLALRWLCCIDNRSLSTHMTCCG